MSFKAVAALLSWTEHAKATSPLGDYSVEAFQRILLQRRLHQDARLLRDEGKSWPRFPRLCGADRLGNGDLKL